jgi:Beta-galactosidase
MTRGTRLTLLLALTLLMAAVTVTPAEAAKRRVPFGFFGSVLPPDFSSSTRVSDATVDEQMAQMARSGVESTRITFTWEALEPTRGAYDFRRLDRLVAAASNHGIAALVNVTATPRWISQRPNTSDYWRSPPTDPRPFAELMRQLVLRYGPAGSLWAQNPTLPRVPVRQWQIWNEQTAPWHWERRPFAPGYTRLLRAAYRAIHGADRGAKVVAGSLVAYSRGTPWVSIRQMYRAGAKRFFDVVAVHPFTNSPSVRRAISQTLLIVELVRKAMRQRGDRRKPIILTELTWPAAVGKVPRNGLVTFATTPRGQVARLKAAYRRLAKERRKWGVTQVYWFNWASSYSATGSPATMSFRFSGLTRYRGGVFSPMPVLRTYSRLAARYEGCRKSANARRCR